MTTGTRRTSHDRSSSRRVRLTAVVAGATLALGVGAPVPTASALAPGSIAGTVTDAAGPLEGIEVTVLDSTPLGLVPVGQDVTDADGEYQVDGINPDPFYAVRFSDPDGDHATEMWDDAIVAPPYAAWVPVTDSGVTSGIDAELEAGSSISGRLTRAGGAPVSGGTVTLWWRASAQSFARVSDHATDADGRWSISGVRGATYALEFSDPATGASETWNDRPDIIGSTALVVPSGEDVTEINAEMGGVVTNVSAPTIAGTPQVGQTLTATSGWQPADTAVTYRWVVGDDTTPDDDPRGATYVPTAQDVGKSIRVEATGTRGAGWVPATAWSAATAPVAATPVVVPPVLSMVNKRLPLIKGTLRVGRVVRVTTGAWTPYPKKLTFRWYAGKRAIKGATRQRFTLTKKQAGKRLRVVVTASAPKYQSLAVTTKRTAKVKR